MTTLLLVDDEVPFVETMSKRLNKRNMSILTAFSGQEALDLLKKNNNVDVVILDVKMPGMDGIDVLKEIKKDYPLIQVIMLTGHGTIESGIEGMKRGAFDYLTKPCNIDVLLNKVKEAKEIKAKHEEKITQARIEQIALRRGD
ncbi:MAG: response regulator [Desulfobacterales bacterium]|nr:response regulator [Desulfobacterales bacterium]MBF0395802.1 response regulator [Desulfobacterales bacterium]